MKFNSVLKVVGKVYDLANKTSIKVPWKRGLRPSGFPYCGVEDLWYLLNGGKQGEQGFGIDYYGGVGTAAHRTFQKFMGRTGVVIGDWKCLCGKETKWSAKSICECGLNMEYQEVGIHRGKAGNKNIGGFIDCILLIDGKYYILDYKTSSVASLTAHRLLSAYPTEANRAQVLSYCALVENQYNISISGCMLMYIARDNPRDYVIVGEPFDSTNRTAQKQLMRKYNRHYSIASRLYKELDVTDVEFIELIDNKPCTSFENFRTNFGPWAECPLGVSQTCFNRKRLITAFKNCE
jgi:hypothetical protein